MPVGRTITLIRGDGIGPEVVAAAVEAVDLLATGIVWEERPAGASSLGSNGSPLPPATLDSIRRTRLCFKGPLATPIGRGYRSVNVALRQELDLFANVRPVRSIPGVPSRYDKVDIVVVRENTQGMYSGVDHYVDNKRSAGESISIITRAGSERLARFAFDYARAEGRRKVTIVHKANILKKTSGLFLDVVKEVAAGYSDIACDEIIIDNCCMQLVKDPTRFDTLVTTNLFGDILSDLTAGLVGGLGVAPGANIGTDAALYEAVHGTAPDIAGKGIANPAATMLAAVLMLKDLGEREAASRLERAVIAALGDPQARTPDLAGHGNTRTFTDRVLAELRAAAHAGGHPATP